jgi:hypothetical protein
VSVEKSFIVFSDYRFSGKFTICQIGWMRSWNVSLSFHSSIILQVDVRQSKINVRQFFLLKKMKFFNLNTAFDQNWPVWSSININGQWYVAMPESGKSLGIDCWNINLYFKLFFRILASQKVWWPIYINRTSVVAHFK